MLKGNPAHGAKACRAKPASILADQLKEVDFVAAALDCSTKSRAREIPRKLADGRPAPRPLRSEEFPEALPNLAGADLTRVQTDNKACHWVLSQIQAHAERGGASARENPWRSLHWWLRRCCNRDCGQTVAMQRVRGEEPDVSHNACGTTWTRRVLVSQSSLATTAAVWPVGR